MTQEYVRFDGNHYREWTNVQQVVGRAVCVAPRMKVAREQEGMEYRLVTDMEAEGEERAIWEMFPDDFEDNDLFQRNIVGLLNRIVEVRGWAGYFRDMAGAAWFKASSLWGRG